MLLSRVANWFQDRFIAFAWLAAVGDKDEGTLLRCKAEGCADAIKLRPTEDPLPATVWLDLRGEHKEDPMEFMDELLQ